jgi:hypothetical protein
MGAPIICKTSDLIAATVTLRRTNRPWPNEAPESVAEFSADGHAIDLIKTVIGGIFK